ncbi:MAG: sterol desaturase family protein [Alphaproteobacteria bacterium]
MPNLPDPVTLAVPAFVLLVIAEMIFIRVTGRGRFEARDCATSLTMGIGNLVSKLAFGGVALAWFTLIEPFKLFDLGWSWWVWILCFVFDDFLYYVWHRTAHRVRWFWADHVVHHSSQHYNLTTALRQPWLGVVTMSFIVFGTWQVLLGFPIAMIAFCGALNLVYQFWIHTETIGRMPAWFEAVMNTPSHHRVHHATNPRYLDRNFAGVFIIWDRMFGTFQAERRSDPCRYGIIHNLTTFNPLIIATHEYWGILRDVFRSRSPGQALSHILRPPGWSPDGSWDTADMIRARWQAREASEGRPDPRAHG